ncbi:hypothetical protein M434DRAFT_69036 [Hypoxylon sp. CO27-5]|nr:hypothetical protein M434DRAFT_69036 [Hypoxylon sp. CO27-5]
MFTIFSARMNPVTMPGSRGSEPRIPSKIGKVKKQKVMRACDSCRVNRIKCDDESPCQNCRHRGENCTTSMPWEAHSLQAAKREIGRLQEQLKELKEKQTSLDHYSEIVRDTTHLKKTNDDPSIIKEVMGEQMHAVDAEFGNELDSFDLFNPCRMSSFNQRMSQYLEHASTQSHPILFLEPTGPYLEHGTYPSPGNGGGRQPELSRAKERHLLNLFWQGFDFIYPILDRDEILNHHDALWSNAAAAGSLSSTRSPSALIDIILALSMQFSSSFLICDDSDRVLRWKNPGSVDSSVAGQWLYDRSRRLLLEEQQEPAFQSVLGSILLTVYILNTGSLNLAIISLAISVRTAQILSIDEDSPLAHELSGRDRELRRNAWRTLVALDGYLATVMELSPLIHQPSLILTLPVNLWESNTAILTSSNDENIQNDIMTAFQICHTKLIMVLTSAHTPSHSKQKKQRYHNANNINYEIANPESIAGCMARKLGAVQHWVETVPPVLTNSRKAGKGKPFSPLDGPYLILDPNIPLWLQRQRLIFEITYNHLNLLVLKQFVRFENQDSSSRIEQADSYSLIGLKHAISLTFIVNHAFAEGDALTGWHFVFRCQWDATLYILGYILANLTSPLIPEAHRSVSVAIQTFSILEKYLCVASSALDIIRDILNRISTISNPLGVILSPANRMLATPSRKSSSASAAGFISESPCYSNSESYTISPELMSPRNSPWDSILQSPFDPTRGSAGSSYSSQPRNREHFASSPLSGSEAQCSGPLDVEIGGVLDGGNGMVFDSDWRSFMTGV